MSLYRYTTISSDTFLGAQHPVHMLQMVRMLFKLTQYQFTLSEFGDLIPAFLFLLLYVVVVFSSVFFFGSRDLL